MSFKKNSTSKEKPAKKAPSKVLRAFRIVKNVLFGVIFASLIILMIIILTARINGETPKLFGRAVYRVSSASMVPYLKVGDIILCEDCDPMTLKEGDVITYNGTSGQFAGKRVTHRVVKAPYFNPSDEKYYLMTKGDDNPTEDSPIEISQVTGKYVQKIDFLKSIYDFFITPWGLLTVIAIILLAFSSEIYNLIRAVLGLDAEKEENIQKVIDRVQREDAEEQKRLLEKQQQAVAKKQHKAIKKGATLQGKLRRKK